MELTDDERELLSGLRGLHTKFRDRTFAIYGRINPFTEDLFDWHERGEFWTKDKTITIYNSTSVVGNVVIGSHTWIGPFCSLDGTGGLQVGHHCSISLGCQLVSHDTVKWALSGGVAPYEYAPISIGDCCFLGSHVVVAKGVSIGSHSVVAAGAVVTKSVPACSIVGGVPGRVIGSVRIDPDNSVHLDYKR